MKGLLANRKLLILVGAVVLVLFGAGYLLVPSSLPKPIHVRLEMGGASVGAKSGGEAAAEAASEPAEPAPEPKYEEPAGEKGEEEEPLGPVAPIQHLAPRGRGIMFPLGQRIVNLADPGGYRYLRVDITLEFLPESVEFYRLPPEQREEEEAKIKEDLMKQKPVIDDVVISVLSSKTFAEVFTLEGKQQLKEELKEKLNEALAGEHYVGAVYFTDFVVQ